MFRFYNSKELTMTCIDPTDFDFNRMIESTQRLSEDTFKNYTNTKDLLICCKEQNILIIGNPLYSLGNEFLHLHYLTLQHITNCELYQGIPNPIPYDNLFLQQLKGLVLISLDYESSLKGLKLRLSAIPESFLPNISVAS